jgi:hypothetical protein
LRFVKPIASPIAPLTMSLPDLRTITDADILAVLDARGGAAYIGSVETGLSNRLPFAEAPERRRAIERALASGTVVRTPLGLLRRRSVDEQ